MTPTWVSVGPNSRNSIVVTYLVEGDCAEPAPDPVFVSSFSIASTPSMPSTNLSRPLHFGSHPAEQFRLPRCTTTAAATTTTTRKSPHSIYDRANSHAASFPALSPFRFIVLGVLELRQRFESFLKATALQWFDDQPFQLSA